MVNLGTWIGKHRKLVMILAVLLLLPAVYGYLSTETAYDLLVYLPEDLDTVRGQELMVDEYGIGSFASIMLENKDMEELTAIKADLEKVPNVKAVVWYDDFVDLFPLGLMEQELKNQFFRGDSTLMMVLIATSTSSEEAMNAIKDMRQVLDEHCYVSGFSAVNSDIKDLMMSDMGMYGLIAVVLSVIAMALLGDSFLVPPIFLIGVFFSIVYNMGTSFLLGKMSYITKAIASVLQLAVTLDGSIFLLHSYREQKVLYPEDRELAMGHAIAKTFKSIVASATTTIAGFISLCFMTFTLGIDMGLNMAKGVAFGVLTCITILPCLLLFFETAIEKTRRPIRLTKIDQVSSFIIKHYKVWLVIFLLLIIPAYYGYRNIDINYDMQGTMPKSLPAVQANRKITETYGASNIQLLLIPKDVAKEQRQAFLEQLQELPGVTSVLDAGMLNNPFIDDQKLAPSIQQIKGAMQHSHYFPVIINTGFRTGSDEVASQIAAIKDFMQKYAPESLLMGEAPMMHDMTVVTAKDFERVSLFSIIAILIILILVYRSLSLPILIEAVIIFAIIINVGISYYLGTSLLFITNIVLGTVQLGSTVDYAILLTNRYQTERRAGLDKYEAIRRAHQASFLSIVSSGITFFASTIGVSLYSQLEMISSICMLLARGALISTVVVLLVMPGMLLIFDRLILKTSYKFIEK